MNSDATSAVVATAVPQAAGERKLRLDMSRFLDRTVQWAIIITALVAICAALHLGQYVLAPLIAGIIVGFTLGPVSDWLEEFGINAHAAAGLQLVSILLLAGLLGWSLAIPLEKWSTRLPEVGERLSQKWEQLRAPIERLKSVEAQVEKAASSASSPPEVTIKQRGIVSNVISSAADVMARVVIFVGTLYFFLATRTSFRESILRFSPGFRTKLTIARTLRDTETYLSRYVAAISVINACFALAIGLIMHAIGVPQPYLWGVLAGILNFALFVGPIVMTVIMLGVGLATFPDSTMAFAPAAIFLAVHILEGQFITPTILGDRLTLNPLAVFASIAFWLWLWGPVGAFLAVPILIITTMAIYHSMPTLAPVSFSLIRKREWRPGLNRFGQVPSSPVVRIRRRVGLHHH
jgi:predicted PurR-regulated permease PerM